MKVLVAHGSRRGGTAGLAEWIAQTLHAEQLDVECKPAAEISDLAPYDAVILGGALYAHRWCREARRFVARHAAALRRMPVWMFSSGPLDDSATEHAIDPVPSVAKAMARVGARGHVTFGGRLDADAKGFIASKMAKQHAGDWRDEDQVRKWATDIARDLATHPDAVPFTPQPRGLLVALCAFVAVTAIPGGLMLVLAPDGRYLKAPASLLEHVPFESFLVPGLLLLFVVGGINAFATWLAIRRDYQANEIAFAGGAALLGWIVIEMVLLRTINAFQVTYFLIAIGILIAVVRRVRVERAMQGAHP